jgi:acetyl-CoA acetyltransferase family protein
MDTYCGFYMAQTAENLAKKYSITREAQDEFALRSHQLGAKAVDDGLFAQEIVPVLVEKKGQKFAVDQDDHIKPETTIEALKSLRPAFGKEGTVTAGNASGIVDGAAAVIVTTAEAAKRNNLKPMGRIVDWAYCGVPPEVMGIGPAPAIREVLKKSGLMLDKIDLFEINEAFSAQYLAVEKELELDRRRVNVNGGAIALGHPLGATGTRLVLTLLHTLKRTGRRLGIASACIGGGQGIALLVESTS